MTEKKYPPSDATPAAKPRERSEETADSSIRAEKRGNSRDSGYGSSRDSNYEGRRGAGRDSERGAGRDSERGAGRDSERGAGRYAERSAGRDSERGAGRDESTPRGNRSYDRQKPGAGHGQQGRDAHKNRAGHGRAVPGDAPSGAAAALIELDRDLMKLLVRRATLVSRIRDGKDHAASPAAILSEKAVRTAWESGALSFSKDPRFTRELFALLQEVKVLGKDEAASRKSFGLAPQKAPAAAALTGPTGTKSVQMRVCLAAFLGTPLTLESVMLSSALSETINVCRNAGANVAITPGGNGFCRIEIQGGAPLSLSGKSAFIGNDKFLFYLVAFFTAGTTGICRFTGAARLNHADLSPLRHALPLFGARLGHVVPHSRGLPANIESSGEIPPLVVVPEDLSFDAVCALLLAPLVWGKPVTLNLASLPAAIASAALAKVRPIHREAGAEIETHGPHIVYTPAPLTPPERPVLSLDPILSAYLLAMPAFTGGEALLKGEWPGYMPEAREAQDLLAWSGLKVTASEESIAVSQSIEPFLLPVQSNDICAALGPLYVAFSAKRHFSGGKSLPRSSALFPQNETEQGLCAEMLSRLGLEWTESGMVQTAPPAALSSEDSPAAHAETSVAASQARPQALPQSLPQSLPWTAPNAYWGMAYALCAFMKPGLQLANPDIIKEVMPFFWDVYNGMPTPADPALARPKAVQEEKDAPPKRRRLIAH